jgi:phage tail protein X
MSEASVFARRLVIWLIPFAVIVAALGFETDWGRSAGRDPAAAATAPPQPVAVALLPEYRVQGGLEARKETVDRVLFNPTRRAAPPATQAAGSTSTMKRGLYTLTGTTVVDKVATAFLREVNGGKSRSVRQGETLNGMLVAEVRADSVRLRQGDDVEDLQLKVAAGPRTTVQTAVVTAAPGGATQQPQQPGAGAAAAGGSGTPIPGRALQRPLAPPAQAGQPRANGTASVSELLAERRRAARANADAAGRARGIPGAP